MAKHIHKRFTNEQVKELLQKYTNHEIERKYLQEILGIGKSRFFKLIQDFRNDPGRFSVDYNRSSESKRNASLPKSAKISSKNWPSTKKPSKTKTFRSTNTTTVTLKSV